MRRFRTPFFAIWLFPFAAQAVVPMPLAGPGCDDDGDPSGVADDGFFDKPADCPDDLLRGSCAAHGDGDACLADRHCSWNQDGGYCEGAEWNFLSFVPHRWREQMMENVELALGSGIHLDRAFQLHTGRTDVLIAVIDSGIVWDERDLQSKHYLNRGELPLPNGSDEMPTMGRPAGGNPDCPTADAYDHNQDCVFNIQDYADDIRVSVTASTPYVVDDLVFACHANHPFALNGASRLPRFNDILEPADLLCVFSDGVDDDANGYVDDISGWDFLWDDNNPYDDTRYYHGTGEGRDSSAEGGNGRGNPGSCPNCMLLSVRGGDSFVVDGKDWAVAAIFAVDSGAAVLQSAVGAITNPTLARDAIEYAYARGVFNIMSAADESAQHQNYPGAQGHTTYVHAVRYDADDIDESTTWLNFSNCTNFGAKLLFSTSSTSCSSGAVGITAGVAGLMASAMRDLVDNGAPPLSGSEIQQLFVNAVDDIDLPTSRLDHPNHDPKKYPSVEGWDLWFGYGRLNARTAVEKVVNQQIPPEADLLSPDWWSIVDPTRSPIAVHGTARAPRSTLESWILDYAIGVQPPAAETASGAEKTWTVLAKGERVVERDLLAVFDPAQISGFDPQSRVKRFDTTGENADDNVTKAFAVNRYTVTLRLRVADIEGLTSEDRRAIYVHHDPTWKAGFPRYFGPSGESAVKIFDLDGDWRFEVLFADADGFVHAVTDSGDELPGWPVRTDPTAVRHSKSAAFTHGPDGVAENGDELASDVSIPIMAAVAIGDLDADGSPEVVAADLDGFVYAWRADGQRLSGFPVALPGDIAGADTDRDHVYERGFFASPVLADLDGDDDLEIIGAAMDQQVFALHHDGSLLFRVAGPNDQDDPLKPFTRFVDPEGHAAETEGDRIVSSPAVGDLDGDGNLEIVFGSNHFLKKPSGLFFEHVGLVFAISYDRVAGAPVAFGTTCGHQGPGERCWPLQIPGVFLEILPFVGTGLMASPALADLDGDGTLEIGMTAVGDILPKIYEHRGFVLGENNSAHRELDPNASAYGDNTNSGEKFLSGVLINSGAFGDVGSDGILDYATGTAGFGVVEGFESDGQRVDFDHQLSVWDTKRGTQVEGFPQIMEDLQFFQAPVIVDVDGDKKAEVIAASGTFIVHAFSKDGSRPEGWPKFTGHWVVSPPAFGDIDGDGLLEMAVYTRAGWLFVYETEGAAFGDESAVEWPGFRHDARNTGNYHTTDPVKGAGPPPAGDVTSAPGCGCRSHDTFWPAVAVMVVAFVALARRRSSRTQTN